MNVTADTSRLEARLKELRIALLGQGASHGDLQRALATEAGQCAWKIAQSLGPVTQAEGAEKIERDLMNVFRTTPLTSNLDEDQAYSSVADFTWLYASPVALVGINDEDNQLNATADAAMAMYYGNRAAAPRGNAWVRLGKRGKQVIMRLNRIHLRKSTWSAVKRAIASRLGQSKAAWARTAVELLPAKNIPGWVARQIPTVVSNGKSVYDGTGLNNPETPWVEFGSRAKGVESNPAMQRKILGGIQASEKTLRAKVEKIIKGFTYNWNTGQVFRPTTFDDN